MADGKKDILLDGMLFLRSVGGSSWFEHSALGSSTGKWKHFPAALRRCMVFDH